MGKIYEHCSRVLVYLAPELSPRDKKSLVWSQDTFKLVQGRETMSFEDVVTDLRSALENETCAAGPDGFIFNLNTVASLYMFFLHPWFYRGWVVQEVVLSPSLTIMACGHEIDAEALMWLVDASKHQGRLMRIYGYSLGYSDSTLGYHQFQRTMTLKSSHDSLWMLDSVSAGCKFGLPQDHVFGFLSMTALDIDLDYNLPWSRVFTLAASRIVEAEGFLRILGHFTEMSIL
jgi:hypothetical protein